MALPTPTTGTGRELVLVEPSPQQRTEPSPRSAQVWYQPALTAMALVMPVTVTGKELLVVAPLPSSPQ